MAKKKAKDTEMSYNYNKFNQISPVANVILTIFMIFLAVLIVYPVILMISISLTDEYAIVGNQGYTLIPQKVTLSAYSTVFAYGSALWNSYLVTIVRTVVYTVLALFVMSMYAYVLAQRNFVAHKFYTYYLFFTMIFGAGLIPCYLVNTKFLHLQDTIWILILPGLCSASWVIMMRTFLKTTIPEALFESARIDGASNFRIFVQIVLPLFKPALATIGLFCVVSRWNEWFVAMLYITEKKWLTPLATMLQRIQNEINYLQEMIRHGQIDPSVLIGSTVMPTETFRMAMTVVCTLPIMFAYPFFQRYFIEGLTIGSVKE